MKKMTNSKLFLIIVLSLIGYNVTFAGDVNWFLKMKLNSDRSGSAVLTYWTATSNIKGQDVYNTIPFSDEKIKSSYSSDNNKIESISLSKNNPETTYVNISIKYKDIINLGTAPGFSTSKMSLFSGGDTTVFSFKLEKEGFAPNVNITYGIELPTTEIYRTSGFKSKDNYIVWGIPAERIKTGMDQYAVFKTSADFKSDNKPAGDEPRKGGGCGLFGMEFPLIFCFGLLLLKRKKIGRQ